MNRKSLLLSIVGAFVLLHTALLSPQTARAHCDTLNGLVVQTAKAALQAGDVTPVLKWVRAEDEQEIKAAFARTVAVRSKGDEARELADLYFFETLVRMHRAGEGAPYTGLKPAGTVDPVVALADQALAEGKADKLVTVLTDALAGNLRERFKETLASRKHADDSVAAGREFVKNYVTLTHFVEGLHTMMQEGGHGHHGAGAQPSEKKHGH